jgi:hypothetical protein
MSFRSVQAASTTTTHASTAVEAVAFLSREGEVTEVAGFPRGARAKLSEVA